MKIEHEIAFTPIIITIETEDEAKILWAILNTSTESIKNAHWGNKDIMTNIKNSSSIATKFWKQFNEIYRPPEAYQG